MIRFLPSVMLAGLALQITGCGSADGSGHTVVDPRNEREFSAQDKSLARALSLGNTQILEAADPYTQAIICDDAVGALLARLRESRTLNANQLEQLERLRGQYTRQATSLATAQGKNASSIAADKAAAREKAGDASDQARTAIGCVQRLQSQPSANRPV